MANIILCATSAQARHDGRTSNSCFITREEDTKSLQ